MDFVTPYINGVTKWLLKTGKRAVLDTISGNMAYRVKKRVFEFVPFKPLGIWKELIFVCHDSAYSKSTILAFTLEVNSNGNATIEFFDSEAIFSVSNLAFVVDWFTNLTFVTQSNDTNENHVVVIASNYSIGINTYGMTDYDTATGTQWSWRPTSFTNPVFYSFYPAYTRSYTEPQLSEEGVIQCLGRRSYTLNDEGVMIAYNPTVWKVQTLDESNPPGFRNRYLYYSRYITSGSYPDFANGLSIVEDHDYKDYSNATDYVRDRKTVFPIMAFGKDKALWIEFEDIETHTYASVGNGLPPPDNVVTVTIANIMSGANRLKVGNAGSFITISDKPKSSHNENVTVFTWSDTTDSYTDFSDNTNIAVLDCDSLDDHLVVLYSENQAINNSSYTIVTEGGIEISRVESASSTLRLTYKIACIKNGVLSHIETICLVSGSQSSSGGPITYSTAGEFIRYASCQINGDAIAYRCVIHSINDNTIHGAGLFSSPDEGELAAMNQSFDRTVHGIISLTNAAKGEYSITEANAEALFGDLYANYYAGGTYKMPGAIGVHRGYV
jgi:hypothetical protein